MSDRPLVAVVDYGIGNLRSAQKSLERWGADAQLTDDPQQIAQADGVALPGVGHFGTCVTRLREAGLERPTLDAIAADKPFIAICVGMQMLFEGSEEAPDVAGLGALPGTVRLLPQGLPRPQMQWNRLRFTPHARTAGETTERSPGLLDGLADGVWMYFVHSYAADTEPELVVATCDYPSPVTAMVRRGQLWGTQFHPEKSGRPGGKLIANFVELVRAAAGRGGATDAAAPGAVATVAA